MTPLHRAVIENDAKSLSDENFIKEWRHVPDALGFTPLEIAKFLGKYDAVRLLGGSLPFSFQLQPKGMSRPLDLSLEGFEKATGIHYRPFLTFSSYDSLKDAVNNCPYVLRSRFLAADNYEWTIAYWNELAAGKTAPMVIRWIDSTVGYGAFASENIASGTFIAEYTGMVRRLFRRHADQNPYCFHYPTKFWSLKYFVVDSMKEGNLSRFINHSNSPNLKPVCLVDRKLLHLAFIAWREIKQGEQLTFDYGEDYWRKRERVNLKGIY